MLRISAGLLACAATLAAQTTVIRLGTLVPKDSVWYELLVKMGDDWKKSSGGKIKLDIYPGGEQGDEPEMLQKIRIKKLQAVAISGAGLSSISSYVAGLQVPLLLDSYEELDYVRDKLAARLEADIAKRGFVVLNWGDAGWVHFFTKRPATRPDDIRAMKLCTLQGDATSFAIYQQVGFSPRRACLHRHLYWPANRSGGRHPGPPLFVLTNQWFNGAKYMLDIKFLQLVGATIITKEVWDRFPAPLQKQFMESGRAAGVGLRQEIRKAEAGSIP